jgi:hypothetical protein
MRKNVKEDPATILERGAKRYVERSSIQRAK